MQRRKPFDHVTSFDVAYFLILALLLGTSSAVAADAISFEGKTITIIVGTGTGGTTDASARLMGQYLSKYLPGMPSTIVQNRPSAHSLAAMSYFAQQVKPDGLTVAVGSGSQLDPSNYRVPQSRYDPTDFAMVGGIDLGGGVIIIRKDAQARLTDKTAKPVVMGAASGLPHSAMLQAAWGIDHLGWNVKWVSGYPSQTSAITLALERGEVEMTGFASAGLTGPLLDQSKYAVLYQTGSNRCTRLSSLSALQGTPLFAETMKGKIADPLAQKAFDYWCNSASVTTWMALPPGTPAVIIDTYRAAFNKLGADPAFLEQGRMFSADLSAVSYEAITATTRAYGQASPEVIDFMPQMLRRQGLELN
jgi:tripartite-type tricarboxylate transporter receptor subunit TctC